MPTHACARWFCLLLLLLIKTVGLPEGHGASAVSGGLAVSTLATNLTEPIKLSIARNGEVWFCERPGSVKVWNPADGKVRLAGFRPLSKGPEDGLLALALDPGFSTNRWLYLFHSEIGRLENYVSRYTVVDGLIDTNSQKILLRFPDDRGVNHSGGGLDFDAQGCLYVGTGDNTFVAESDGYAPLDTRPGRELHDSQRTAANSKDWRGKILRIRPTPEGGYTIPPGNLFPPDGSEGLPEIYIMGVRNPFRLSIDPATGWLYWGDVGPDALESSPTRGAAGFDEFNVAMKAGNYGWPYFVADNKPYVDYDFETRKSGEKFDPARPVNRSRNNSGAKVLPPAQPALIWYPPGPSARWPELGSGARSAMAGPVYHYDPALKSDLKLPERFDKALFVFDWERGWIREVRLDVNGKLLKINPFLPERKFKRPISMEFGPDGALYVVEWGSNWSNNKDSALIRIQAARTTE